MNVGSGIDLEGILWPFKGLRIRIEERINYLAYANTPLKTNESPLKNDGWSRCISYWNSSFFGDMLIFRGVSQNSIPLVYSQKTTEDFLLFLCQASFMSHILLPFFAWFAPCRLFCLQTSLLLRDRSWVSGKFTKYRDLVHMPSPKLAANAPENSPFAPEGKDRLPKHPLFTWMSQKVSRWLVSGL